MNPLIGPFKPNSLVPSAKSVAPSLGGGGAANPYPIPSDYSAHWKAGDLLFSDDGVTPIVNGATVYRWNSQNGSHPLLQTSAAARGTYATNVLNGLPSVDFVTGDSIATAALQNNTSTLVVLFQMTSNSIFQVIYDANTSNVRSVYLPAGSYTQLAAYSPITGFTGTFNISTPTLIVVRYEVGVAWQLRINRANAGSFTCNANPTGPSKFFPTGVGGKLFEAMEYPRVLSESEVLQAEAYVANRFAL